MGKGLSRKNSNVKVDWRPRGMATVTTPRLPSFCAEGHSPGEKAYRAALFPAPVASWESQATPVLPPGQTLSFLFLAVLHHQGLVASLPHSYSVSMVLKAIGSKLR